MINTKRMSDTAFRQCVEGRLQEDHIAPFTRLVDKLRQDERGNMPYIAPTFGGTKATGLLLFQDPGPATNASGMLCHQNNDNSAARLTRLLDKSEIDPSTLNAWNSYPWYINRKPTPDEIMSALPALAAVLDLMNWQERKLCVYLGGVTAWDTWARFVEACPKMSANIKACKGRHTSDLAATVKGMTKDAVENEIMLPTFQAFALAMKNRRC